MVSTLSVFREYDIRGRVGEEINTEFCYEVGRALATVYKKLVIGMDKRESSKDIYKAVIDGMLDSGGNVITLSVLPTPVVAFTAKKLNCYGVQITASHNPKGYNGMKIFSNMGRALSRGERCFEQVYFKRKWVKGNGSVERYNAKKAYINAFPKKNLKLSVVIDIGDGVGEFMGKVLKRIGCKVRIIRGVRFKYNPSVENITTLKELSSTCDAGFAVDGDCDRLMVVDEKGNVVDINRLIILFSKGKEIVTTFETSNMIERYAKVKRVKTGDTFISRELRRSNALLGAEASGHFLWKEWLLYSDPIYTSYKLLSMMNNEKKPLSELLASTPEIFVERFNMPYASGWEERLSKWRCVNTGDGVKIIFEKGYGFIRRSVTEGVLRVTIESKDRRYLNYMRSMLENALNIKKI